jgi:hypothetical protein
MLPEVSVIVLVLETGERWCNGTLQFLYATHLANHVVRLQSVEISSAFGDEHVDIEQMAGGNPS